MITSGESGGATTSPIRGTLEVVHYVLLIQFLQGHVISTAANLCDPWSVASTSHWWSFAQRPMPASFRISIQRSLFALLPHTSSSIQRVPKCNLSVWWRAAQRSSSIRLAHSHGGGGLVLRGYSRCQQRFGNGSCSLFASLASRNKSSVQQNTRTKIKALSSTDVFGIAEGLSCPLRCSLIAASILNRPNTSSHFVRLKQKAMEPPQVFP